MQPIQQQPPPTQEGLRKWYDEQNVRTRSSEILQFLIQAQKRIDPKFVERFNVRGPLLSSLGQRRAVTLASADLLVRVLGNIPTGAAHQALPGVRAVRSPRHAAHADPDLPARLDPHGTSLRPVGLIEVNVLTTGG